jgi:hypothetical protein
VRLELCRDRSRGRVFRGLRIVRGRHLSKRRLLCADVQITERIGAHRAFLFLSAGDAQCAIRMPGRVVWTYLFNHWSKENGTQADDGTGHGKQQVEDIKGGDRIGSS